MPRPPLPDPDADPKTALRNLVLSENSIREAVARLETLPMDVSLAATIRRLNALLAVLKGEDG